MCTATRFPLIAISFLAMAYFTYADSASVTTEAQEGVSLETGEMDNSTVQVDSFTVVIHEGEGRPTISKASASLVKEKGYVKVLDSETLTLSTAPDGLPVRIAVGRKKTPILVGTAIKGNRDGENAIVEGKEEQAKAGRRISRKLLGGSILGAMCATMGYGLGGAVDNHNCGDDDEDEIFCIEEGAVLGMFIGFAVGPAIGVSAMDPYDRFKYSLAGSLTGALLGREIVNAFITQRLITLRNLFLYPIIIHGSSLALATLGSEWSRNRPKDRSSKRYQAYGFLIRLAPDLTKGFLAEVTLRF